MTFKGGVGVREATVKIKIKAFYYLCLLKHEVLKFVSEGKALKYFDKWTIDINENQDKYFKVISNR